MASRKEKARRAAASSRANSTPAPYDPEPEPWTPCTSVFHDDLDCAESGLLRQEWCDGCRAAFPLWPA